MDARSVIAAAVAAAATGIFAGGLLWRIALYLRTPQPLPIPTTPAPRSRAGVVLRMVREIGLFESLFRANLWTWGLGWVFHACLALVLLRHLRYCTQPIWTWVVFLQPLGKLAALGMVGALGGLWLRRVAVERVRFISTPSDHLMLALLLAIGGSGLLMTFAVHTDVVAVKTFVLGLLRADLQRLPGDALLLAHLALVAALLAVFPFSKLLHAPGVFFSPTRNQANDTRERRYRARWVARAETGI